MRLKALLAALLLVSSTLGRAATTPALPVVTLVPAPVATPAPTETDAVKHITLKADDDRTVLFKGDVTADSADALTTAVYDLDDDNHKPIYIVINSPGGDVTAGFKIENALDAVKSKKICVVESLAASMAGGILLHCDERYVMPHAEVMYHAGSMSVNGPRYETYTEVKHWMDMFAQMDADNAKRLGMSLADYQAKTDHEWWLTDEQAVQAHAAQAIVDGFRYKAKETATPKPVLPAMPWGLPF